MDPDPRDARREHRRAQTRRRRRVATAVVALLALGAGFGLSRVVGGRSSGGSGAPGPTGAATATAPATTTRAAPRPRAPGGLPSAAEQRAAVERLIALGLPIYRGGGRGDAVALTFDDGPGPYTPKAIDALRANGARATFFLNAKELAPYGDHVASEKPVAAIGNHTWHHYDLATLGAARMRSEIVDSQRAIARAAGRPVTLMRPPYGSRSPAIDAEVRRSGELEILWSVDSRDSLGAGWEEILATCRSVKPGAIVLMHENRGQTIKAVNRCLPALRKRGIRMVTVPELLALDPPTLEQVRADARNFAGVSTG
ncbi:MAG: polysaccharide deacetylase family protein [Thermoleophilia bacterium]